MKKFLCIIVALLMFLSSTACKTTTLEDACNKADEIVAHYGPLISPDLNIEGIFLPEQNTYAVTVYPYSSFNQGNDSRIYGGLLIYMFNATNELIYPKLEELFKPHDVTIGFFLFDKDGNMQESIIDNVYQQ